MWLWLRNTCVPFYDTYWTHRGFEEYGRIFKKKPFSNLDKTEISNDEVNKLLSAELDKITWHFGEGRLNPSTIACIIAEVESKLEAKYGT